MGSGEGYLAGKGFRQRNSRCRGGHVLTRSKDWKERLLRLNVGGSEHPT